MEFIKDERKLIERVKEIDENFCIQVNNDGGLKTIKITDSEGKDVTPDETKTNKLNAVFVDVGFKTK